MTVYTTPNGSEIVICDSCGKDEDGTTPDVSGLKPVDTTEGLRAYLRAGGFDEATVQGCAISIKDYCPACEEKRKESASA